MAVPKRKTSKMKLRSRKSANKQKWQDNSVCPVCNSPKLSHRVCPSCGTYNNKKIVVKSEE